MRSLPKPNSKITADDASSASGSSAPYPAPASGQLRGISPNAALISMKRCRQPCRASCRAGWPGPVSCRASRAGSSTEPNGHGAGRRTPRSEAEMRTHACASPGAGGA